MSELALQLIAENKRTKSKTLDLGNCGLTKLPKELFDCVWLEELILANDQWNSTKKLWIPSKNKGEKNEFTAIHPEIGVLKELRKLKAGSHSHDVWEISDINFLSSLNNLEYLDLRFCSIKDISCLSDLKSLTYLDLTGNRISGISTMGLIGGIYPKHSEYDIETIFSYELPKLKFLDLSFNGISKIRFTGNLCSLESLELSSNFISELYLDSKLSNLQSLDLSFNRISTLNFLRFATNLKTLSLQYNDISEIKILQGLSNLEFLNLGSNKVSDISFLKDLTGLHSLDLRHNNLKKVSLNFFKMNMEIYLGEYSTNGLLIDDNRLESPPIEIIKQGKKSVLDWFAAQKKKLNEIKVILIGEPDAGKTSLLRRLKDNSFIAGEVPTDGINIEQIAFGNSTHFSKQTGLHQLTGYFWDFGGQEILNSSHQFFLTNRSVYMLVLDARKDTRVAEQLSQWIKRIRSTGGNSPIIVVANQIDVNRGFGFQNEYELIREFPQVECFITASCATGENIDLIREKMAELIPQAEMFNTEVDERWIPIKETLQAETKSKHFLSEERFIEVCQQHQLTERDGQRNAINFFHDLGLVLHFENLDLAAYYVLDPYWITYGVYQILTSNIAGINKGIVGMDELDFIINHEQDKKECYKTANYRKILYSTNERRFLVDILHEFKLSFYLPDRTHFIIPDLLDTSEPLSATKPIRDAADSIAFIYRYDYLPQSVMPNIMVKANHLLSAMWRTGCVLENNGCKALVSNYQSEITIIVTGGHRQKREFMAIIRHLVDAINQQLRYNPSMLIPLPDGYPAVDYEELLEKEKDGEKYYTVYKPHKRRFDISVLLEGVPTMDEVRDKKLDIVLGMLGNIKEDIQTFIENQTALTAKLDTHFNELIVQIGNNDKNTALLESIKEITADQSATITHEVFEWLAELFEAADSSMDDKLKQVYDDLKKSDNVEMKLKLSIPLISLLGIDVETKYDIKGWAKEMYKKHQLKLFQLMGY